MTPKADALPTEALEDVAYLSRSPNRVAILRALVEGPTTRREIAETTETSRTTLDRIVNELEERGWAERTSDGSYVATASGSHLMRQFDPFLESIEGLRRLGEAVAWLPTEELDIDLSHFADAEVRRPRGNDPVDTVEFMTELVQNASSFRALTHLVPPEPLSRAMRDRVVSGKLRTEGVMTADSFAYIAANQERRQRWRESIEAGSTAYQYDGPIPCNVWIADDLVLIKQSGPEAMDESYGVPIVTQNDTVRAWAADLIEQYRADAVELDADFFAEPVPADEA